MNRRHLPPFVAVRAFEAAARTLSFQSAAAELNVTPSAISHQVRSLEGFLGVALFLRAHNRIELTQAGEHYLAELTPLLDALDASTREVAVGGDGRLRVLSTPGFATRWLLPRLGRFPGHAQIDLAVSQGAPCVNFSLNGAEVVIHWGGDPAPGAVVEPMMQSTRYPVASAELIERERLHEPADLRRVTLLHDEVLDAWDAWFSLARVAAPTLPRGPQFAHCELTLSAAERGHGVALAYDAMARGALNDGRLIRLFDVATLPILIYSFTYAEARQRSKAIQAFRQWMFDEVATEGTAARKDEGVQARGCT